MSFPQLRSKLRPRAFSDVPIVPGTTRIRDVIMRGVIVRKR